MKIDAKIAAPAGGRPINILGISAFYHDSAACLVRDGRIIAAAQEERFTRKKHDPAFPQNAVAYCLREGGIEADHLDYVAFYEKPFLKFDRILHSYLAYAPSGLRTFLMAIPLWIRERIWMKELIRQETSCKCKIIFPEHHESHAASAFFPSPYAEAAFLTVDGVGEWTTTSFGAGRGNRIEMLGELHFPHSLGLLYSAFTYFTGFRVNSGEYKLMGLAPYGEPKYVDLILRELLDLKEDGSFRLNMSYFNYGVGLTMTNAKFGRLFGRPPRQAESKLTQSDMDLARSIQDVTEEIMFRMARHVRRETGLKNLCLAGGVALNCVANGRILREGIFDRIWIQPAAGDAGGALGAALFVWHQYLGRERHADGVNDSQRGSFLGPEFSRDEIRAYLTNANIPFTELSDAELPERIADLIKNEKVIGWFYGRMEFGPRALGGRSIIGDAQSPKMQEVMNLKIKFRESFRPFAPSVLHEKCAEWFDLEGGSPYMLLVAPVAKSRRRAMTPDEQKRFGLEKLLTIRSTIPAVTHVDYSARVQTVKQEHSPMYYRMIKKFDEKYGCPVIINTSFNVRGEPIVGTPEHAYLCFMRTNMDYLLIGNFLLEKKDQKPLDRDIDWLKEFESSTEDKMIRDEIKQLKTGARELRKFGLLVGSVFALLGVILLLRHRPAAPYFLIAGALLILPGLVAPRVLKHIYIVWMSLAIVLGFVISSILLILFYLLVITPIGWAARCLGNDFLSLKWNRPAASYWLARPPTPKKPADYERQF